MTESWIDAYVEYRRMVVDEKRKSALAHAIYPTAFGFGGGPVTDYGPNTSNTWAAQGLRALDRVREILE